jgi:hypothetical protein
MGPSARITSIEALKEFRASLCNFGHDAREAITATELEIRRIIDSLEAKLKYWQNQVGVRQEEAARAKAELIRRQQGQRQGWGSGTTEQEIALNKAIRRLREAEDKLEKTRHWQNVLPRALAEYEGPSRQLTAMLDADLARGLAILDQRIDALNAYLTAAPPALGSQAAISPEAKPPGGASPAG